METALKLPEKEYLPELTGIPDQFTLLLFGPPKVGKTTFGAGFPKSILLECEEDGAKYVKCLKADVKTYDELRAYFGLLKGNDRFDTVVIDSLDKVAEWIEKDICAELGLSTIMDTKKGERFGSQWSMYVDKVLTFIQGWKALGKKLVLLAHTKKAELSDGNVINPKTINLYGQAANRVMAVVENIGFLYADQQADGTVKRFLSFRPGVYVEAGSRHPSLTDKVIELPRENSYKVFWALFQPATVNGTKQAEAVIGGKTK